ncbi:MAG: carboxypeptidase regulatory-like domain-containing protein [bacterium]|nr:carboxypeptidase regulatory-like domain-containing protein [bacterium]
MRKIFGLGLMLVSLCFFAGMVAAQPGVVQGVVSDTAGVGIDSVHVTLSRMCGGGGGTSYSTYTNAGGAYVFPAVAPNNYKLKAMKTGYRMAMQNVTVPAGQTLTINLTLTPGGCGGGGGGCHPDTVVVVNVEGYALVDTTGCMDMYYLDTDNNGEADYRLNFGPPSYDPGSGATRPEAGDFITITGGLVPKAGIDMIVVYTINGLFWRNPVQTNNVNLPELPPVADRAAITGTSPNPFNPETSIRFQLPEAGMVSLSVYNLRGQRVAKLVNGNMESGAHQVTWNASHLSSGIYMVRLQLGADVSINRVVLTK